MLAYQSSIFSKMLRRVRERLKRCHNKVADDMALVDLGSDSYTWEKEYESAEKLHFSLLGILNERDNLPTNSPTFSKLSYQLRQQLTQLHGEIKNLKAHLNRLFEGGQLTSREHERRNLLIEDLRNKHKKCQSKLNISSATRNQLLSTPQGVLSQQPSTSVDMEGDHIPHHDLRQMQTQVLAEQDSGLEELSKIIGRQKQMAQAIGDEVTSQNDLIDNITDHVDRTRDRMAQQTNQIGVVDRKDKTFCYWVIIMGLLVAIIVVAAIPKKS